MSELYGLTAEQVSRLSRLASQADRLAGISQADEESYGGGEAVPSEDHTWQLVELSSATANGDGTYNGWFVYTVAGTATRGSTIRIKQLSGATLGTSLYYWAFYSHFDTVNDKAVFIVPDSSATGGGGGTSAIDTSAGTPSLAAGPLTPATIYGFSTTGIALGEVGANKGFFCLDASDVQTGVVNTTTQVFFGDKGLLNSDFVLSDTTGFDPSAAADWQGVAVSTTGLSWRERDSSYGDQFTGSLSFTWNGTHGGSGRGTIAKINCGSTGFGGFGGTFQLFHSYRTDTDTYYNGGTLEYANLKCQLYQVTVGFQPCFSIFNDGGEQDGIYDTSGYYNVAGGIIVGLSGGMSSAANIPYTVANSADWSGADPVTIASALDRLAAAVAGLLGSAIP